jgi:hypothetical protein
MEIRIVVFLAFVSFTLITNTVLLVFAYKAFARVTSKVTETMSDVTQNAATREWIDSFQVAAERAASLTESTKLKMTEFDQVLGRAQEDYRRTLVSVDSSAERVAADITTASQNMRDIVAKPVSAFASGLTKILKDL